LNIEVNLGKVFTKFLYLILFLLFANVIGILSSFYFGHDNVYGLVPLFNFNKEHNIPTLYSSFALIFASILLSIIATTHRKRSSSYFPWLGLAIIFLFLSIDETAQIHEKLTPYFRELFNTSGLLYYAWVIPNGIFVAGLAIVYLKFLMRLPNKIMILFVVSGTTFVSGAIGFEMLSGRLTYNYGRDSLLYAFYYSCEEFFEMLGIVIFIYTLLLYIARQFQFLTISFNQEEPQVACLAKLKLFQKIFK